MRVMACVGLVAVCVGLTGCNLFSKKQAASNGGGGAGAAFAQNQRGFAGPVGGGGPVTPAGVNGILAGQVVDSYNRRVQGTMIQVVALNDPKQAAPVEVAADAQGYFIIQSLIPGQTYQLTARAKDGGRLLTGTTQVSPPNSRVLISVSDDLVTATTPPLPGPPTFPGNSFPSADANSNPARQPVELGAPIKSAVPAPEAPAATPPAPSRDLSHVIRIQPAVPPTEPVKPEAAVSSPGLTGVPSCKLTGQRLENFALNDLNGGIWEFRQHRGRLVLLDFSSTSCIPCRAATWHLKLLQQYYGPHGLEVVGIDYQMTPVTLAEQVRKVSSLRDQLRINYRLLIGGNAQTCPVKQQFGVERYPTLFLLDENGQILWRSEGLGEAELKELEGLIKQRLGIR